MGHGNGRYLSLIKNYTRLLGEALRKKTGRETAIVVILLLASALINLPQYQNERKVFQMYYEQQRLNRGDWESSEPEEQDVYSGILLEARVLMQRTEALSLIVARHGRLVMEEYYNGASPEGYNNTYAITQSVVSMLIGIAIDKGDIKGIDQRVSEFISGGFFSGDTLAKDMTIRHLLTMTQGFSDNPAELSESKNRLEYILNLPMRYKPGEKYIYADSASCLLSAVITRAAGMNAGEYADKHLFGPLNIVKKRWNTDAQRNNMGYSDLYMNPRDLAKLGQLFLNEGKWKGSSLVNPAWVKESTGTQILRTNAQKGDFLEGFGFLWQTGVAEKHRYYMAEGYGGQYLMVIPDIDIVVVMTSRPDPYLGFDKSIVKELLREYVIPSIKK